MKQIFGISRRLLIMLVPLAMVACGGGGDVAGDSTEFSTNPDELTIKSAGCAGGHQLFVSIVGGQPPYRIHNPYPGGLYIDRTEASGKDPRFKLTTLGGCMEEMPVLVLDYHSRSATFSVTVKEPD